MYIKIQYGTNNKTIYYYWSMRYARETFNTTYSIYLKDLHDGNI